MKCTFFYICAKNVQKAHTNTTQKLNFYTYGEKSSH